MENKNVGWLVIGISVLIILIISLFNSALKEFVNSSCTLAHGDGICPMYDTINKQTYLSLGIVGIVIIIGLVLIISKPSQRIIVRTIKERKEKRKIDISDLTNEERRVLRMIEEEGTIFQSNIIDKTGLAKAKITRIIDRLEGKGIVERKRRGMTNIVVLKD